MSLALTVEDNALVFTSTEFALYIGSRRIVLPSWLSPGTLTVIHRECRDNTFEFRMTVQHRLFGELIHQTMRFTEASDKEDRS